MRRAPLFLLITMLTGGVLHTANARSDDKIKFTQIFDGKTLNGWKGEAKRWRVENGAIVGEIPTGQRLDHNTWLVWEDGNLEDFELRLQFRLTGKPAANSGIQFRCQAASVNRVSGYQADLDMGAKWLGRIYDEHGRALLVERGTRVLIKEDGERVVEQFAMADRYRVLFRENDWNDYRIRACDEHMTIEVNGTLFSELVDRQKGEKDLSGQLAFQLHSGPETRIEFRNIRIRKLKPGELKVKFKTTPIQRDEKDTGVFPTGDDSKPLSENPILSQLVRNPAATAQGGAAAETVRKMHLPAGFIAELIAAEPQVVQPIAFAFDARGRIWVVEGLSYPQKRPDGQGLDRILIFSDEDGDGRFESRKVFIEGLNLASGLEVGYGGVWVGAAPQLLFIPDRDQNDQPDSAPQVLLDGFGSQDTHEALNSLIWGPDGWLYGNQGVFNYSRIGKPGSSDDDRVELRAGVWRYHPIRHQFEVFAHGGSNQWGLDFNEYGQLFMTHCRSRWGRGPTTHVIQGAHYWNQANRNYADFVSGTAPAGYPFLRNYLLASARYGHGEGGAGKPGSRAVYGGHSHVGTMIYLGDNWPDTYRDHLFTHNLHGRQINHQVNRRDGSGFNTVHAGNDVFFCEDVRHIGIDLKYGPDGAVYTIDWYDQRLCHNPNVEQWDRTNGRIYRIAFAESFTPVRVDLARLDDQGLVQMLLHKNDWYVRTARRLLHQRAVAGKISPAVRRELFGLAQNHPDASRRLRGLWALHAVGGMDDRVALQLLQDANEYVRAWTIQLVTDDRQVGESLQSQFVELAHDDPSAVVRLYLASAMGRLEAETAWQIAQALSQRGEDAGERNLPCMIWYGVARLVPHDVERAFRLARESQLPVLPHFVHWYVAKGKGDGLNRIIQMIGNSAGSARQDLLEETSLALTGQHPVAMPRDWSRIADGLYQDDSPRIRRLAERLGATFGDESLYPRKRRILADRRANLDERRHAFRILSQVSDPNALPLFLTLLDDSAFRSDALLTLAGYAEPEVGAALVDRFASFSEKDRTAAFNTLTSRESWAHALLDSVAEGRIEKAHLSAYYVRQLSNLNSKTIDEKLAKQWGKVERSSEEKLAQIAKLEQSYRAAPLWAYSAREGKKHFRKLCSSCHRVDNDGTDIGPKLTGSGSKGIRYFAENIVDPNAVTGTDFQTSIIITSDGRVVSGLLEQSTDTAVTLLTPTNPPKKFVIPRSDIELIKKTGQSLMPERMLESLNERQIIELFKYLNTM